MMWYLLDKKTLFGFCSALLFLALPVHAQEAQSLSVTPPLFQIEAVPGQSWQSAIKVINTNSFPLTVYANPVDFEPVGESGQGRFLPILNEETQNGTLASWINVAGEVFTIAPEESFDIPFSVAVPADAPPGGHFAAILIGTKPPDTSSELAVRTSQVVTSLLFLRVAGDINEAASIREFSVARTIVTKPKADFSFRFENSGNVHIQPQGDITIFNMWGKERGTIPINHQSRFGNVLPGSIRKFDFSWEGERAISDIGKYTAVITVTYGTDSRQNASQEVTFWFIPLKEAGIVLFILLVVIAGLRWAISSYVRFMLRQAGIDPDERQRKTMILSRMERKPEAAAPVAPEVPADRPRSAFIAFIVAHRTFVVGIPIATLLLSVIIWFIAEALTTERGYEVTIVEEDAARTINSEEARLPQIEERPAPLDEAREQQFRLVLVNASGEIGLAASEAQRLKEASYIVDAVEPELEKTARRTVVVAPPTMTDAAKKLSEYYGNALVSIVPEETTGDLPTITVYLGEDRK